MVEDGSHNGHGSEGGLEINMTRGNAERRAEAENECDHSGEAGNEQTD